MFMEERLNEILAIIKEEKKVLVKELSEKFNVSESMIRKDLQRLEKEGKIKRTYGGAILERESSYDEKTNSRVFIDLESKSYLGELVVDIIEDNDVVFLDISTTNHTIAMMLGATKKNLTIITNMNRIAMEFDRAPNVDVILIGGRYNKKLGGTVGSAAIEEIKKFKITKAFVGAGGINIEENFISNFNYDEAAVKKEILRCSKKRYIVANYEKLYKDGAYKFATLDDIDYIVTEKEPEGNIKEILNQKEVKVIC
ncbi:DeoR/GlpR family DNA-binding transcription regulator [uncultured Clostridium sp.]|uniref:DeoR/GlpR family DNA-binding transcription regulator n=1 Tax=Clostridium sp. TaxID=1506 RepID=UPI0025E072CF|nr:DeoR/GlpR family DNA-binding transcription regulator [uncultured Clostridium sp.]